MKVNELYLQVSQLGFVDFLDSAVRDRFYFTANRALLQVAALRPRVKECIISHNPPTNLLENEKRECEVDGELVFVAENVKAYYFEFEGSGEARIEYLDGADWSPCADVISLAYGSVSRKGIVKHDGELGKKGTYRLKFSNNGFILRVKNVALYGEIYSDNVDLIPDYQSYTRYDISKLADDFWALHIPLLRNDSTFEIVGTGYDIEDNRVILLPRSATGIYRVSYTHKPVRIDSTDDPLENDDDIDLDDELCELLPLLVASYIWLDEDAEKAQYYLGLYRENAVYVQSRKNDKTPIAITTNGWA